MGQILSFIAAYLSATPMTHDFSATFAWIDATRSVPMSTAGQLLVLFDAGIDAELTHAFDTRFGAHEPCPHKPSHCIAWDGGHVQLQLWDAREPSDSTTYGTITAY